MSKIKRALLDANFDLNKIDSSKFGAKDLELFLFLRENKNKIIESSPNKHMNSSSDAVSNILNHKNIAALEVEVFGVLGINNANNVVGIEIIHKGGLNQCLVDFKVLFSKLLKMKASAFVLFHNHPSGKTYPSGADEKLTSDVKKASDVMKIILMDHIIIGKGGSYFSFADEGLLRNE